MNSRRGAIPVPRTRVAALLIFAFAVALLPPGAFAAAGLHAGLLAAGLAALGASPRDWARRFVPAAPFIVLLAAATLLAGAPAWVAEAGHARWVGAADPALRGLLGAAAAAGLAAVCSPAEFVQGARGLGAPAVLAESLAQALRQFSILREEAARMRRAAEARGFRPRWIRDASIAGRWAGSLLLRTHDRAERVHRAALARGGEAFAVSAGPLPGRIDAVSLAIWIAALWAIRRVAA